MEDSNSTGGSESELSEVLQFNCKRCPGKTFSAAELDEHKQFHKAEKLRQKLRPRNDNPKEPKAGSSTSANARKTRRTVKKRQSNKNFDTTVVHQRSKGA